MKIRFNKIALLTMVSGCFVLSCSEEATDISTITKVEDFSILGLPDQIVLPEMDSTYTFNFNFDDKQIFEFGLSIAPGSNSTATEGSDFDLGSHEVSVATLQKSGSFELQIHSDLFLESDESIFLTFTTDNPLGQPLKKTMEVVIKNIGGCPEYVHSNYVGDYEVVSDEWNDWKVGDVLNIVNEGANKLSFKYNCGDALPIIFSVDPATFGISAAKQQYCSYDLPPLTQFFGDVVEATSAVNTCDKMLSITIAHTDANMTAYGSGKIVLKKK